MEHHDNSHLSPEEKKFNDFIQRGDDLLNIDQYTPAAECYQKALDINFNNEVAQARLDKLAGLKKFEFSTILKILGAAAIIVIVVLVILNT